MVTPKVVELQRGTAHSLSRRPPQRELVAASLLRLKPVRGPGAEPYDIARTMRVWG